jgi:hypothetical protein
MDLDVLIRNGTFSLPGSKTLQKRKLKNINWQSKKKLKIVIYRAKELKSKT